MSGIGRRFHTGDDRLRNVPPRASAESISLESSDSEGVADVANVAEQVNEFLQESECPIWLSPATAEDTGPLVTVGIDCNHKFHMQCIVQWGTSCPVCHGPLNIETPPPLDRSRVDWRAVISASTEFREDELRPNTVADQANFVGNLGVVVRVAIPVDGPGSQLIPVEQEEEFANRWFGARGMEAATYLLGTFPHTVEVC